MDDDNETEAVNDRRKSPSFCFASSVLIAHNLYEFQYDSRASMKMVQKDRIFVSMYTFCQQ